MRRARSARDVTDHRQEERVDLRLVRRLLEQQQRQRPAAAGAQPGRVAVGAVVELARDLLDAGRVSGLTSGLSRSARETVACDTCASWAISREVSFGVFTAQAAGVGADARRPRIQ